MSNEQNIKPLSYLIPCEAGLTSEVKAVCRRVGKMLDALSDINGWIAEGELQQECWEFKISVINKLTAEGWTVRTPKNKTVVTAPKDYGKRVGVKGVK